MDYNEKLDQLFKDWERESIKNGHDIITKDGLMRICDADVNLLWEKSEKRILFLLKDQPNSKGDDTRNWLILPDDDPNAIKNRNVKPLFLRRLAYLFYGLSYDVTNFGDIALEQVIECFNTRPFAFVEAKKQSGTTTVKDAEMDKYMETYGEYLIKEINILQPHIIVCCGGPQYHFALHTLYNMDDLECIDKNLYYNSADDTVVLYAPHPSYPRAGSYANYFESVMWHYTKYLEKYKS